MRASARFEPSQFHLTEEAIVQKKRQDNGPDRRCLDCDGAGYFTYRNDVDLYCHNCGGTGVGFREGDLVELRKEKMPKGFKSTYSARGIVVAVRPANGGCLVLHNPIWWRFWDRRKVGPFGWSFRELTLVETP